MYVLSNNKYICISIHIKFVFFFFLKQTCHYKPRLLFSTFLRGKKEKNMLVGDDISISTWLVGSPTDHLHNYLRWGDTHQVDAL